MLIRVFAALQLILVAAMAALLLASCVTVPCPPGLYAEAMSHGWACVKP